MANRHPFVDFFVGQSAANKDLSGMIGADADFTNVNFKEAQISK